MARPLVKPLVQLEALEVAGGCLETSHFFVTRALPALPLLLRSLLIAIDRPTPPSR